MAGLTHQQRAALPAAEFALPSSRKLPIHDKQHVVLAWNASDALKGDERLTAKSAILRRAHALGVDTSSWHLTTVALNARALDFGDYTEHSNRWPFTGVLCYVDEPSDRPPGGSSGKNVILSAAAAHNAIPSLLGMAIDFAPEFDGHAPKRKIGLITGADVEGNELKIAGFFWAADFPEEVSLIRANRDKLGFSYECMSMMEDRAADPLVIAACEFTGAAVLFKDKAAYMKTSLAARADQGETTMDKDLQDALAALTSGITAISASVAAIPQAVGTAVMSALKANGEADLQTRIDAAKAQIPVLRQNAQTLRNSGLEAAAQGLEAQALQMEQAVAAGKAPPEFKPGAAYVAPAQLAASGGLTAKDLKDAMSPVVDGLAALLTVSKDTQIKIEAGSGTAPQRKTLTPATTQALTKIGLTAGADGKAMIKVADLDAACQKAAISAIESTAIKLALKEAGQLATA